jgi:hypothetical protein
MIRYLTWAPIFALALASCTAGRPATSDGMVDRATKGREEAIVLERSVWVVAENASAGPFSYEVLDRTKVLSFNGLKRRKVAVALPPKAELVSFEGRTMQPDGRTLTADADAAKVQDDKLVFELPQPAVGATLEYKFKVRCTLSLALFYWQFQRGVPVVRSEMTVSWPKSSKLGYQVVNAPSGQPTDPEINTDESSLALAHWSFFDLTARPPGGERFAIVVGPKELLTEENREKGVGWRNGFPVNDGHLPRTNPPRGGSTGQPSSSSLGKGP